MREVLQPDRSEIVYAHDVDPRTGARYTLAYAYGQLASITADDGDVLSFQYGKHGLLERLDMTEVPPGATAAVTRTVVSYAYDDALRLVQVSTALASDSQDSASLFTTRYTYDGDSLRISDPTRSLSLFTNWRISSRNLPFHCSQVCPGNWRPSW